MSATVETTSKLGRKLTVSVPMQPLMEEVDQRIKRMARTAKLAGFRPGKVPLKIVEQQYGEQVRNEVFSNTVEKTFSEAVQENKLRVAGYPDIQHKPFGEVIESFEYTATFEVFPEVVLGDLSKVKLEKPTVEIGDAEVDKTIDVLLKQRAIYEPVKVAAKKADKVNVGLRALIDGNEVERTNEQGIDLVIGAGGRYPEFDDNLIGTKAGGAKTFDITYPEGHQPEQLSGKKVTYEVTVNSVERPKLPEVNADFAKALGVENGDIAQMREEIKASLQLEVEKRVKAKLKEQVFNVLVANTEVELPASLIHLEIDRLGQMAQRNLQERGVDLSTVRLEPAMFEEQAKQGVKLRLILSELVNKEGLTATGEQVRAMVDQFGQSFEQPEDVVRWYYADPKRLDEPAALATEENVVEWVLKAAKVTNKKVKFDDLMGNA
jgi:trigger factor